MDIKKVLVIGSGPIIIGQAAEFDYAGTQACKSLREEGVSVVLINSNPATIMTDREVADKVYIEPLTIEVIERIIASERPQGLLPTLGGQTGLNLAVQLADAGILEKYNVTSLGTPISSIRLAEDREAFRSLLNRIGEPTPDSEIVETVEEGEHALVKIGLPAVIRPAYTLGGTGGGIASTVHDYRKFITSGLAASPISQVLVERSLVGWKEVEYEVMRDSADNCITVCNMENFDPMGVHTGDSIVVAPSQTLTDKDYHLLRTASLNIIRALGVEGGCNVQLALRPGSLISSKLGLGEYKGPEYYVIEVNPRVSRSSALASKATGYPIARVAAKIAIGRKLDEIPNQVTGKTSAAFEPALDYCIVKIPRWPFDKFAKGDRSLGTQMKATGEVMAIERTFEAAFLKAVRSLEITSRDILWDPGLTEINETTASLKPHDERLWFLLSALRHNHDPIKLSEITYVDPWFINSLNRIVSMETRLLNEVITNQLMQLAKSMGFSDAQIATLTDRTETQVRQFRLKEGIRPVYKMVDTCAGEFEAQTSYFYSTYEQENEALPLQGPKVVVIGSGPIRIGQGIEFDYCSVHASQALRDSGVQSIMVNSNPETVSTDFDSSDRLYFEPLDSESIMDIIENETTLGPLSSDVPNTIVQFGGQTAINLSQSLESAGLGILGSTARTIDIASDRHLFEEFLKRLNIPNPPGSAVADTKEALKVADEIGYPVLVRPSYVLGGRAMEIVQTPSELKKYMAIAFEAGIGRRVLVDKYFEGREVEVDAVCDGNDVLIPGIMEHVERAGVHSGDSMAIYPGLTLSTDEVNTIVDYTTKIGKGLGIKGLMNIQYVLLGGTSYRSPSAPNESRQPSKPEVYVIEVNPRSSRTIPFISKVTNVPMIKLAVNSMMGISLEKQGYSGGLAKKQNVVAVKAPVFSMAKLTGVDTYLGPEMKSTGEVMGIDYDFSSAVSKALISAGLMLPKEGSMLLSIADKDKPDARTLIKQLNQSGYHFYATEGTAKMITELGFEVVAITKRLGEGHPNVVDIISEGSVDGVINTVTGDREVLQDGFAIRRVSAEKGVPCFTSIDTARAVAESINRPNDHYNVLPLEEYLDL
ncbi:MAG: carbamoyl-phosphate synthase large subunit [Chloroflexi bacterium]|nr:MAG: carbamoyl-phosphate synthase large subunit [Chloroflexota bacterium]